jgi:hypothetical protein
LKKLIIDRRTFLETSAVAAGATIVPRHVLGGPGFIAPSDKIHVGYVGCGTQGLRLLMDFLRKPEIIVVAVCDVNKDSQDYPEWSKNEIRDKVRTFLKAPNWGKGNKGCRCGRNVGKEIVETYYKNLGQPSFECATFIHYQEMLDNQKDLDAVCVMTPEHTHATIAIAAMEKGKHTIMHKPLSNIVSEIRLVAETAKRTGVATHMFCSADSTTTPLIKEWINAGAIGTVKAVHNWSSRPFWPQGITALPTETPAVPNGFNWDLWLGPAEYRPYHPSYTHATFRGWYDFGSGPLGDMGHYSFYQIWRILDLGGPQSVEASRSEYWSIANGTWHKEINNISFPRAGKVHWEFPAGKNRGPVSIHWYDGGLRPPKPKELETDGREMPKEGMLIVGDKGKILAEFSGGSPRLIPEKKMQVFKRPPQTLPRPIEELDQWIQACYGEKPSDARFEVLRPVSESLILGTVALRIPDKLKWDADNMRFDDNNDANKLLYRKYRAGWELKV